MKNEGRLAPLGVFVRQRLKAKGWTQKELLSQAGLTRPALLSLMRGETKPRKATVERLALALGVSVEDILRQVESSERAQLFERLAAELSQWLPADQAAKVAFRVVYNL